MARGGGNENQGAGSEMTMIVALIVIGGALFLSWVMFKAQVVLFAYGLDWLQIKAYQLLVGIGENGTKQLDYVQSFFDGRRLSDTESWAIFIDNSGYVGQVMSIPLSAIMAVLGGVVIMFMKGNGFKEQLSLKRFISYQRQQWKTLAPSERFNPDIDNPLTEPAMNPAEWLHGLGLKARLDPGGTLSEESREVVEKAMIKQLGPAWMPIPRLKRHVRCLVAIMATHGGKARNAIEVRSAIAEAYADIKDKKKLAERLDEIIKPVLENKKLLEPLLAEAEKHAYVSTVLIAYLKEVRLARGVLASSEFRWLKPIDRDLWYTLNNVGRWAFHIEAAGATCHYFYEQVAQRALPEPKVDNAILGLEDYLGHHGYDELV